MLNSMIKENKGVIIFILLILVFSFVASKRVDTLEKMDISNPQSLVYNK